MIYFCTSARVPILYGQFQNSSGFNSEHENRSLFHFILAASFQHLGTFEAIEWRSYILVFSRLYFNPLMPGVNKKVTHICRFV